MTRGECWLSFSEALDLYLDARARIEHFGEGSNQRYARDDLKTAKDHMDALTDSTYLRTAS